MKRVPIVLAVMAVVALCGLSVIVVMRRSSSPPLSRPVAEPRDEDGPRDARRMPVADLLALQAGARALVIDVRIESSFLAGHIAGAINVPLDEVGLRGPELLRLASGRPIVTYCSCVHEHTSAVAALALTAAGARDVSALLGGYPEWVAQNGPVER